MNYFLLNSLKINKFLYEGQYIKIEWYSALIVLGALIALSMILKEAKRYNYQTDFVFNMCFWAIMFGIVGARAYYVIFELDRFPDFWSIFKIWEGGLAIYGGIIAGFITIFLYCKKYKVRVIRMLDFIAPALLLAQAIGRWGNFFNGEAYGGPVSLSFLESLHLPKFIIDGMYITKEASYMHPTFLYESLWCLLGVVIILIFRRLKKTKVGQPTALYLMWYGIGRFFIESMRYDSLMLGGFRVSQIVSIVLVIIGVVIVMVTSRKGLYQDLYDQDDNQVLRF